MERNHWRVGVVLLASLALGAFGAPAASWAMSVGDSIPDLKAPNQKDLPVKLSSFRGKYLLIFFYPKDDSPVCTEEALRFKEVYSEIEKLGAVVIGISRQGSKDHEEFIKKHELPFQLLVDQDGAISEAFGVGKVPLLGWIRRKSVLISPEGKLVRFYDDVKAEKHAKQVLEDLRQLQNGQNNQNSQNSQNKK